MYSIAVHVICVLFAPYFKRNMKKTRKKKRIYKSGNVLYTVSMCPEVTVSAQLTINKWKIMVNCTIIHSITILININIGAKIVAVMYSGLKYDI